MNWQDYIEACPGVALGKPVLKGTRLTVQFVLERLGDGATVDELVAEYVGLTADHMRAAVAFAAAVLRGEQSVPIGPKATPAERRAAMDRVRELSKTLSLGGLRIKDLIREGRR